LGVVPVQIPDRLADPEYTYHEGGNLGGYRTLLGVPAPIFRASAADSQNGRLRDR
jgi:hypothetical protein